MSTTKVGHLARRFVTSLSRKPPPPDEVTWALSHMDDSETSLWSTMSNADRRHSIEVARRFDAAMPDATRDAMVAALLHDVGKTQSGLGTLTRVVATVVGPRTARFRLYFDHERLGAEMVRDAGGSEEAARLIDGTATDREAMSALQAADDI